MKVLLSLALAVGVIGLSGCYKTTIRPQGGLVTERMANFERSHPFFLFGLIGEAHVDTSQICSTEPKQMQSHHTFVDGLIGAVTIGIYTPATSRVWCQ